MFTNLITAMKDSELFAPSALRTLAEISLPYADDAIGLKEDIGVSAISFLYSRKAELATKKDAEAAGFHAKAENIRILIRRAIDSDNLPKVKIGKQSFDAEEALSLFEDAENDALEAAEEAREAMTKLYNIGYGINEYGNGFIRIHVRVIFGYKEAFSVFEVPSLESAVKACKSYTLKHIATIGVDTTSNDYKETKAAVSGFMEWFYEISGKHVNLNKEENVFLIKNIFGSSGFRFLRNKDTKTVTVEIAGNIDIERQLLLCIIYKLSGRKLVKDGVVTVNTITD